MKLDEVSKNIVALALLLDQRKSGLVSEIWIEANEIDVIKNLIENIKVENFLIKRSFIK